MALIATGDNLNDAREHRETASYKRPTWVARPSKSQMRNPSRAPEKGRRSGSVLWPLGRGVGAARLVAPVFLGFTMTVSLLCPACQAKLKAPEASAGRTLRCPRCRQSITVPASTPAARQVQDRDDEIENVAIDSASRVLEDSDSIDNPSLAERGISSKKRIGLTVAVALFVVGVAGVGLGIVLFLKRGGDEHRGKKEEQVVAQQDKAAELHAERNRDFFQITEPMIDATAAASMSMCWLNDYPKHTQRGDFDAAEAASVISENCILRARAGEAKLLNAQRHFLAKHGMNAKEWGPTFRKSYPEMDLILDEVKQAVRTACDAQMLKVSLHFVGQFDKIRMDLNAQAKQDPDLNRQLNLKGPRLIQERFHEYRMEYLRAHASKMLEEVLRDVNAVNTIKQLRAKVHGQAG